MKAEVSRQETVFFTEACLLFIQVATFKKGLSPHQITGRLNLQQQTVFWEAQSEG